MIMPTLDEQVRFASLVAMREAHRDLLVRYARKQAADCTSLLDAIEQFVRGGQAIGAILDDRDDRQAAQDLLDYWTSVLNRAHREISLPLLADFDAELAPELPDEMCPYVGLDSFREADADRFFGRAELVDSFLRVLRTGRLLAVVGPSGSGKSSVVRAGLLPRLKTDGLPGSGRWRFYPVLVPGADPLTNLVRAIRPPDAAPGPAAWVALQTERIRLDHSLFARLVEAQGSEPAVLVIDQFEELYTFDRGPNGQAVIRAFLDALLGLLESTVAPHVVLVTMRSDFLPSVATHEDWLAAFQAGQVEVPALGSSQLRQAIEAPAKRIGLKFDDGVVADLVSGIVGQQAALPLLQFTLLKLWQRRRRNRILWQTYRDLIKDAGGQSGPLWALAHVADQVYAGLTPEQQPTARRIFLSLVQQGEDLEFRSRRICRRELFASGEAAYRVEAVLDRLVAEYLLRVSQEDVPDDAQVEIAHEALVRNWPRLREWLTDAWSQRLQRARLRQAASDWRRSGHDALRLWRGSLLAEAETYIGLSADEQEFVRASRLSEDAAELAHQRQVQRLRQLVAITIGVALLALAALAVAVWFAFDAGSSARMARSHQLAAESRGISPERIDQALLIGLAAWRAAPTSDARGAVIAALRRAPALQAYLWGGSPTILSLAVGDNGMIAASGPDGMATLWNIQTRQVDGPPLHLDGGATTITSVEFGTAGLLATADDTSHVQLWDVASRTRIGRPISAGGGLAQVEFSTDGRRLAIAAGNTISVWDVSSPSEPALTQRISAGSAIIRVALSPNGQVLAASVVGARDGDFGIRLWSAETGELLGTLNGHTRAVYALAFSPDSSRLASGGDDLAIRLWDVGEQTERAVLPGHQARVNSIAFSPDGQTLVSGGCARPESDCAAGEVRRWDMASGKPHGAPLIGHTGNVTAVRVSPGAPMIVSAGTDGRVALWQLRDPEPVNYGAPGPIVGMAVNSETGLLATAASNRAITLWDLRTRSVVGSIVALQAPSESLAFGAGGMLLAASGCAQTSEAGPCTGVTQLFDVPSGTMHGSPLQAPGQTPGKVRTVAFSPSRQLMVSSGSSDGWIVLWDVATGRELGQPLNGGSAVRSLAFSPDGKLLASGHADHGTVRVWDVAQRSLKYELPGPPGDVLCVAFSPDGMMLASAGSDARIRLWDARTGGPIGQALRGHTGPVTALDFSADGTLLASGSQDQSVIVWDVASHEQMPDRRIANNSSVSGVAFVRNNGQEHLLQASSELLEWDLQTRLESLEQTVCTVANHDLTTEDWHAFNIGQAYERLCPTLPVLSTAGSQ